MSQDRVSVSVRFRVIFLLSLGLRFCKFYGLGQFLV